MMAGLAICAEPVVSILLTDKWLPCVPFMVVFCIALALHPIHTANLNAIMAVGRSDLYLKLEVIKKLIDFAILFSTMWISVEAIAWGFLASTVIEQIINAWPNKKLIDYPLTEQIKDLLPNILITICMCALVYGIASHINNRWLSLGACVMVGAPF